MISLTRFSGQRFALNPDLIERVEATPDTVITLVDGSRQVVVEPLDDIVAKVQHFRATVVALSQHIDVTAAAAPQTVPPTPGDDGPSLRLIQRSGGQAGGDR